MPFDPKLIPLEEPPEDHEGDLELSNDLSELGSQLRRESEELSSRFPIESPTSWLKDHPVNSARVAEQKSASLPSKWSLILLGISIALLLCTGVFWAIPGAKNLDSNLVNRNAPTDEPRGAGDSTDGIADPSAPDEHSVAQQTSVSKNRVGFNDENVIAGYYHAPSDGIGIRELMATDANVNHEELTNEERIALLEKSLDRYQSVIVYLQEQLMRREKENLQAAELIDSLKAEVDALKKQLAACRQTDLNESD